MTNVLTDALDKNDLIGASTTTMPDELSVKPDYLGFFYLSSPMFKKNIMVKLIDEGGNCLIVSDDYPVYGYGETTQSAVYDFISMLNDLYRELKEDKDILAEPLKYQLHQLRKLFA
jgi:hypothetical protein